MVRRGTVIIDRDGRIAKIISGVVDPVLLRKQIETLLSRASNNTASSETKRSTPAKDQKPEVSAVPS